MTWLSYAEEEMTEKSSFLCKSSLIQTDLFISVAFFHLEKLKPFSANICIIKKISINHTEQKDWTDIFRFQRNISNNKIKIALFWFGMWSTYPRICIRRRNFSFCDLSSSFTFIYRQRTKLLFKLLIGWKSSEDKQ